MREFIRRLSRWDKALLGLVGVYLLLWPFEPLSPLILTIRIILQIAIYLTGSVVLMRYVVRGMRAMARRFLWRVRHRMIAVYLFVGFIPLTLAFLLNSLGFYLLIGPLAAYMVSSRIEQRAATLQATAASLGWELRAAPAGERRATAMAFFEGTAERYPHIMARFETPQRSATYPPDALIDAPPKSLENSQGVVLERGRLFLAAHAQYAPGSPSVLLMVPLTTEYMAGLLPGLGPVEVDAELAQRSSRLGDQPGNSRPPAGPAPAGERALQPSSALPRPPEAPEPEPPPREPIRSQRRNVLSRLDSPSRARLLPPPAHPFDYAIPWPAQVPVIDWESGESFLSTAFILRTRPSAVARLLFSNQSPEVAQGVRTLSYILGGLFAGAVIISFIVALSLTRTLTRAIHALYVSTLHINRGDFSHRVALRGENQLTELGRSFNTMTASIERLIEDSRERERLQAELEIAREVQTQLFPKAVPTMKSLEVLGICRPAQTVSGDFYDYFDLSSSRLAMAFGDVAGKGISAALVMAALHSIVRTQLSALAYTNGGAGATMSTAELVARINSQLYAGTSSEKFATLFFGTYDEPSSVLCYSNAGHLPPLLLRKGQVTRLNVDGMIVGAFPHSAYESSKVELVAGDLLVAYSDGITEPENPYDEEFGEARLIELLLRDADQPIEQIIHTVMQEVVAWTGRTALQDDMTMLVARRH